MSETTETVKKALMFQLKNPDGSVNWMMSVFVWVFLLLILFIVVYFPMKAMKSKFGNTQAADEPLMIYIKSGLTSRDDADNRSTPFIMNVLQQINQKSAPGTHVENEMTQEIIGDEMVTRRKIEFDASLGSTTQIIYSSGLKSLFGGLPKGAVLANLTTLNTDGVYNPDTSILERYTDSRICWMRINFYPAMPISQQTAMKNALEAIADSNTRFKVVFMKSDVGLSANRAQISLTGGGRLEPELPGHPWFDQFDVQPPLPTIVLSLENIPATWSDFTSQQKTTLVSLASAIRKKRPTPTMQTAYLIEAPESKMDVANAVADYLKNVKHFAPYETTTVKIETSDTFNIMLTSMASSLGAEWKRVTMPVLLTTVPAEIRVTSDQICQAVTSSVKMFNDLVRAPEPENAKTAGPVVIRLESDMDPVYMRSRLELMNYLGNTDPQITVIWKYVQNKNRNRPRGAMYAYLESYDQKFVSTLPAELQTMVARVPMGSFLGVTKAHYLVNGLDFARAGPNPLLATDREIAQAADPLAIFVETGKGSLPNEEDIINSLGCPTPDPCPSCPPEKVCPTPDPCPSCPPERVCPTPDPCPSCPTFDVATMCPKPEPCPTFDVDKMCPSKPVWPLKNPIPATAKSFNLNYTATKTQAIVAASLAEAVQMRITFAQKPNAIFKPVAKSGYNTNVIGVEYYNPVTKKNVVKNVAVAANNVRKGVDDIYAIIEPYL